MNQKFVIVSGGTIEDTFAIKWLEEYQPDYIIAADSGMSFFYRTGKKPNMIIGDFDSVSSEVLAYFKKQEGILWKELNPIKDDTDTEFAIRQAIGLGAKEITILGATGSRLDHVMGNIALLGIGREEGVAMQIVDANNRIRLMDTSFSIRKEEQFGRYVSLLPYQGAIRHLTLKGFFYCLEDATMEPFRSLGISNEIKEEKGEVIFEEGCLLVIESRD